MPTRRHRSRDESSYRTRHLGAAEFRTSRTGFGDASVVAYRFPCRAPQKTTPDFVLVHGIGVSARSYGPTAVELARFGDVHLLDLPGYGRAPRPERDMSVADHAAVVARYLDARNLDHPVVVGHSMGTQIAAQLCADFPDLADHLALIGPVVVPGARSLPKLAGLLLRDGLREPPAVTALAVHDYLFRTGVPYTMEQMPHLLAADLEEVAPRVLAKTLVICGRNDPIVPTEWAIQLTSRFRKGWFVTVPGPHSSMFAAPELIAGLLTDHARR